MEEAEEDLVPPFWLQTSDNLRRADRRRRSPANMFLNSGVLLATLIVVAGMFIFVIVPSFLSFTSQIFKPHSVKKSWDSLNLVLVAFAIVCGFLSRNSDGGSRDQSSSADLVPRDVPRSDPSTVEGPDRWSGFSDRTVEYRSMNRMRSSRSYSDLGLDSSGVDGGDRWRFHDDTYLQGGRAFVSDQDPIHGGDRWRFHGDTYLQGSRASGSDQDQIHGGERMGKRKVEEEEEDLEIKNVVAESFVVEEHEATSFRPPVPPSPPPPAVSLPPTPEKVKPAPKRAPRKTSRDPEIGRYFEARELRPPPPEVAVNPAPEREYHYAQPMKRTDEFRPSLPPRPESVVADPAPPNRPFQYPEISGRRNFEELQPPSPPPEAKARPRAPPAKGAKRKGKRAHQAEEYEERRAKLDIDAGPSQPPPSAPSHSTAERNGKVKRRGATAKVWIALNRKRRTKPKEKSVENLETFSSHAPPPPPPPPPFTFSNLFSPRKNNKTKKIHSIPPPPPPPLLAARNPNPRNRNLMSQSQSQAIHVSTRKPPLPVRTSIFNDETPNTGNLSPLNSIPPPPPPPPFSYQSWKFRRQGDFVRINSDNSSRSGSPELEDVDDNSGTSSTNTPTAADGGDSVAALFCPSPDVDTKADTFIARFRAGLTMEKMNSVRVRSKSNLGRESSPDSGPCFL